MMVLLLAAVRAWTTSLVRTNPTFVYCCQFIFPTVGLSQLMNTPRPQRRNTNGSPSPERANTVNIYCPNPPNSDALAQGGTGFRVEYNRGPGVSRTIYLGGSPTLGGNRRGYVIM